MENLSKQEREQVKQHKSHALDRDEHSSSVLRLTVKVQSTRAHVESLK